MENKNLTILITRIFSDPVEKLWQAWTNPEVFKKWWGPKGFTAPEVYIDLRQGGRYLTSMRGPDGKIYWSTGAYKEIIPEKKLVMTDSFADEKGNPVSAAFYGMSADFPLEMLITVTFEEEPEDGTRLTIQHEGIPSSDIEMAAEGWKQSFEKLAKELNPNRSPLVS